jgi:hypothetical protein
VEQGESPFLFSVIQGFIRCGPQAFIEGQLERSFRSIMVGYRSRSAHPDGGRDHSEQRQECASI